MGYGLFRRQGNTLGPKVSDGLQSACLIVEVSQIVVHEGDEPDALVELFDSDHLAGEDLAQVDLAGVEAECRDLRLRTAVKPKPPIRGPNRTTTLGFSVPPVRACKRAGHRGRFARCLKARTEA
jgi:hypothetical protein